MGGLVFEWTLHTCSVIKRLKLNFILAEVIILIIDIQIILISIIISCCCL